MNPKLDDAIPWNSSTVHSFKEKAAREAAVTNKALSTCTLRRESGMVDIDRCEIKSSQLLIGLNINTPLRRLNDL